MNAPADKTSALIAALWQKNKPIVEERLSVLEKFSITSSNQQREEVISAAHKLSGSLGMYGYPIASEIAAKIEHLLKHEPSTEITGLVSAIRQNLGMITGS